jgi:hypothetical protein
VEVARGIGEHGQHIFGGGRVPGVLGRVGSQCRPFLPPFLVKGRQIEPGVGIRPPCRSVDALKQGSGGGPCRLPGMSKAHKDRARRARSGQRTDEKPPVMQNHGCYIVWAGSSVGFAVCFFASGSLQTKLLERWTKAPGSDKICGPIFFVLAVRSEVTAPSHTPPWLFSDLRPRVWLNRELGWNGSGTAALKEMKIE